MPSENVVRIILVTLYENYTPIMLINQVLEYLLINFYNSIAFFVLL